MKSESEGFSLHFSLIFTEKFHFHNAVYKLLSLFQIFGQGNVTFQKFDYGLVNAQNFNT